MSNLEELIEKLCPDGVEYKKIGELVDYEQPGNYIVCSTKYSDEYNIPVLTAGQTFILGYINETDGVYKSSKDNPVIIFDDFTAAFKWVDFEFKVKSSAIKILTVNNTLTTIRYIYHVMGFLNISSDEHKRLWIGTYSNIKVPVPPLEVQREIVRILDNFAIATTEIQQKLQEELAARQKQYEYYRDLLLTFKPNESTILNERTNELELSGAIRWMKLGELCDYVDYRGKTPKKVDQGIFLVTAKNVRMGFIDYEKSKEYISKDDYLEVMRRGLPKIGDLLITTEAPCGNVALVDREDIALAQRIIKYRPKRENVNRNFLKHYLLSKEFQDVLQKNATGGTVKGIKGSKLHELNVPVPPLEVQQRIVDILDRFDTLCNDITSGLPAEIEMRQKQYEYYRDKLLTFKELKKEA